jgi:hypothetical protein
MTKLNDDLDRTYQRIYRRLAIGLFVAYGIVLIVAVATLLDGAVSTKSNGVEAISAEDSTPPASQPQLQDQTLRTAKYD